MPTRMRLSIAMVKRKRTMVTTTIVTAMPCITVTLLSLASTSSPLASSSCKASDCGHVGLSQFTGRKDTGSPQ
eukprot:2493460-Pyramimonas_sp.AAC.1